MPLSDEQIDDLLSAPLKTATDEGTVQERSADDLIKLDKYAASKAAIERVPWGLRIARTKPGGTVN